MKKRKEEMSPGYQKNGFLIVGRSTLKALFAPEHEQRGVAIVLLCVQTYAYFSDGYVCLNDRTVPCRAGEWITSYSEIAGITGFDRRLVKKYLINLEERGFLHVHDFGNYKRIVLNAYELKTKTPDKMPPAATPGAAEPDSLPPSILEQANAFYQPSIGGNIWLN